MIKLVCPNCKKPIDTEKNSCPSCNLTYERKRGILDLRPKTFLKKAKEWDLDRFEATYEAIGDYEDHLEAARKKGYDRDFEIYRYAKVKERVKDLIPRNENMAVLDIGCGVGYYLFQIEEELRLANAYFVGLDVALPNVVFFDRKIKHEGKDNFLATLGIAEALPFEDNTFDVIVSSETIEHIEDKDKALSEMFRVLKPGGRLFITTPSKHTTLFWKTIFFVPIVLKRLLCREALDKEKEAAYDKPLGALKFKKLLRKNHFEILRFERNSFLPHESYFPHFPESLKSLTLRAAGALEGNVFFKKILRFFGLHFVVECTKPEKIQD